MKKGELPAFLIGPTDFFVNPTTYSLGPRVCYYCGSRLDRLRVHYERYFCCADCAHPNREICLDGTTKESSVIMTCILNQRGKQPYTFEKNETVVFCDKTGTLDADTAAALNSAHIRYHKYYHIDEFSIIQSENVSYVVADRDIERLTAENLHQLSFILEEQIPLILRLPYFSKSALQHFSYFDFMDEQIHEGQCKVVALIKNQFKYLVLQHQDGTLTFANCASVYTEQLEALNRLLFGKSVEGCLDVIDGLYGARFCDYLYYLKLAKLLDQTLRTQTNLASEKLKLLAQECKAHTAEDAKYGGFLRYIEALFKDERNAPPERE